MRRRWLFPRDDADQFKVGMKVFVFDYRETAVIVPAGEGDIILFEDRHHIAIILQADRAAGGRQTAEFTALDRETELFGALDGDVHGLCNGIAIPILEPTHISDGGD